MSQGYTSGVPKVNDPTLAGNSQFLVPTEYAVKTYVDTAIGALPTPVESVTDDGNGYVTVDNTDPVNPVIGFAGYGLTQVLAENANANATEITNIANATTATSAAAYGQVTVRVLGMTQAAIAHTGTNVETILPGATFLIPADTIGNNDFLEFVTLANKATGSGTLTYRVYNNTSNVLAGAQLLGTNATASNLEIGSIHFRKWLNSSTSTIGAASGQIQYGMVAGVPLAYNINNAVDQYFFVSLQLSNSGDTSNLQYFVIRHHKYV